MSCPRLFVDLPLAVDTPLDIGGEQARYIGRVLRAKVGDEITLFNGRGGEYGARIDAIGKTQILLRPHVHREQELESPLDIRLIQGVSRGDRMDTVVQKATELGVQRITPLLTEFSVVRLDTERADKRCRHWQAIARSACEQCGRNRPPLIDPPCGFSELLAATETPATRLILLPGCAQNLAALGHAPRALELLIGPEGGFSSVEEERAVSAGFVPVSMGARIMRTETAAIAGLAIAQSLWGDLA